MTTTAPGSGGQMSKKHRSRWIELLSFRNISAIYIFLIILLIFGLLIPDTFLSGSVWRTMLDGQVPTALAALAVLIPLVTGNFNLAVGAEVGFAGIMVATLISKLGLPFQLAIVISLCLGALIGLVSGLIITKARIDSFIATLGLSSVLLAGIAWISGSRQILNLGQDFRQLAATEILGVTLPFIILIAVAFLLWYLLERTPVGRRMYATGYNKEGAQLSGIPTTRLIIGSLMLGGAVAALAGILLTARINVGDPLAGPSLLLPALSAVFLGSTQFRGGRFNVWGTILAVYVLATGVKGLQLMGAPNWITDMFNGLALLLAVGFAKFERGARGAAIRRAIFRRRARSEATAQETA